MDFYYLILPCQSFITIALLRNNQVSPRIVGAKAGEGCENSGGGSQVAETASGTSGV
jgi:hypothetical protein